MHLKLLCGLGAATLLAAWLPSISQRLRISGTVILLLAGFLLVALGVPVTGPDPFWPDSWTMVFTEALVIISLMSAGLKIGRTYRSSYWWGTFRLLIITMPLCILAGLVLGHYLVGLPISTAMLLGAVLAPTDPVMASEVQIEPTDVKSPFDNIRFTLTGEASLNDGLAYPFTWLAVMLSQKQGVWSEVDWWDWALNKFLLKVGLGLLIGWIFGRFIGWLLEHLPEKLDIKTRDGFVAFSATFLTYGATELLHGYGFLAVFVAGLTIRQIEESYEGERLKFRLHDFVSEIERLMLAIFLILFGGSMIIGLFSNIGWRPWAFGLLFILIIRPVSGYLALLGTPLCPRERVAVGFLGIRGVGSLFYLTWAFLHSDFGEWRLVYSTLAVVIFLSLLGHGLTARTLLHWAVPGKEDENSSYEVEGEI